MLENASVAETRDREARGCEANKSEFKPNMIESNTTKSNSTDSNVSSPVLTVSNLNIVNSQMTLVDDLSFQISRGETLAIVGESGSGKSISSLALVGLLPESLTVQGKVNLESVGNLPISQSPKDYSKHHKNREKKLREIRGSKIAMIFQEPMTALNPLHTVAKQIGESLRIIGTPKSKIKTRIIELLEDVNIKDPNSKLNRYPHELSGGQRQRVMIAMALAQNPDVLIADEPTTALDVSLQHDILELLDRLKLEHGMAMLLISHDLNLVRRYSNQIIVMQQGHVVEQGLSYDIFTNPKSEYTRTLIEQDFGIHLPLDDLSDLIDLNNISVLDDSKNYHDVANVVAVKNLTVKFPAHKSLFGSVSKWMHAVKGVSFSLNAGNALGIVGESGSGKTTIALALSRLLSNQAKVGGQIVVDGTDVNSLSKKRLRRFRSKIQMVFQDPFASINPRFNVIQIIEEGLLVQGVNKAERTNAVYDVLETVNLPKEMVYRYPHELSGGQRQRIALARALIMRPKVIILDEPTSALDSTTQVSVVELLRDIQSKFKIAYIFISHDLNVVQALCQKIMVLNAGECVEYATTEDLFANPQHPYSQLLINTSVGSKKFDD